MKIFARVVLGAIAGMALCAAVAPAPAPAADLPAYVPYAPIAPPLYNWTACYGGFNIGGGAANKKFTDVNGEFTLVGSDLGSHTVKGVWAAASSAATTRPACSCSVRKACSTRPA